MPKSYRKKKKTITLLAKQTLKLKAEGSEIIMKNINSRLKPFCGNDPLCESEHGGELPYKKCCHAENFLIPPSELKKRLHDYAMQIQQAINGKKDVKKRDRAHRWG